MKYKAGEKIRLERMLKGMKQKDLAEIVGITPPYLSDIENGNRRGSYFTIKKICEALGLDAEEIMLMGVV